MNKRAVTEEDFRKPEFVGKDPKDYEFRADGKVVRKDRWECAVRRIHYLTGGDGDFEIDDIVSRVKALVASIPPRPDTEDDDQEIE